MSAQAPRSSLVNPDTPVVIKVTYNGSNRRFKLPLKDLGAYTLPSKLRQILVIPTDANIILERYSDSAGSYVVLDSENPSVYKQLYRAAKAKLKLRIKATLVEPPPPLESSSPPPPPPLPKTSEEAEDASKRRTSTRGSYLETVLRDPVPAEDDATNNQTSTTHATQPRDPVADAFGPNYAFFKDKTQKDDTKPRNGSEKLGSLFLPGFGRNDCPFHPAFCIDCNNCGANIPNEHYHCSICDDGDYDLCSSCVDAGVLCPGDGHWLIKRIVKDGTVTNSTTETIAPRRYSEPEPEPEPEPENAEEPAEKIATRTCNACFDEYKESELLTCDNCPDYDLCLGCLRVNKHGHHPGHQFSMIDDTVDEGMKRIMTAYCRPGRKEIHAAICDGCEKRIVGVRNKCFNCPDWDYCGDCIKDAAIKHPGHRFAPIYTPIAEQSERPETHFGVFCDGPFCRRFTRATYISGVRYKCTICHDTDFCANCEAHPSNTHNRTHPLIKFNTPVRHVSVSTIGEDGQGAPLNTMGDRRNTKSTSTETVSPLISNAATQVQNRDSETPTLSPEPKPTVEEPKSAEQVELALPGELQAFFVKDTIVDGSTVAPNTVVTQTWTLYNPGPSVWPKGCSVRFIGGDTMFNVDTNHPTSVGSLVSAMESEELSEPVGPLDSAEFTVTLKTPRRVGRAISYWRLKSPEGVPFGHKLWCDVNVAEPVVPMLKDPEIDQVNVERPVEGKSDDGPSSTERSATLEPETEEKSTAESDMIFPKLEKESPIASTHEALSTANADTQDEEHDLVEEVESLGIDDDESEDEGFLTDEEYDILDASDQEYAVEAQKSAQK